MVPLFGKEQIPLARSENSYGLCLVDKSLMPLNRMLQTYFYLSKKLAQNDESHLTRLFVRIFKGSEIQRRNL